MFGTRANAIAGALVLLLAVGPGVMATAAESKVDRPLVAAIAGSASATDNKSSADDVTKSADAQAAKEDKKAAAKPATGDADTKSDKATAAPTVGSPEERSATALAFVREHHPELVELLERLKSSNVAEYDRAIRELARTSDRLSGMRARNPERYALELEIWKLKSQIQLLSARASLAPNEDVTSELRALIERQLEVRAAQLELERSDLAERLDRVETALQAAEADHQSQLDKQLNDVLRGIDVARQREADRRAKKTAPAAEKSKRDKKETKKPAKGDKKPKADVKKDVKRDATPETKKESDK